MSDKYYKNLMKTIENMHDEGPFSKTVVYTTMLAAIATNLAIIADKLEGIEESLDGPLEGIEEALNGSKDTI